jgi:DNA polymerase I-like protein with 3'-5' exonuclease and polymerase domains
MITQLDGSKVDWGNMPLADMAKGNSLDAFYTLCLYEVLVKELEKIDLLKYYDTLSSPLINKLADIELRGMTIDQTKLDEINPLMVNKVEECRATLHAFPQVRADDNIKSTDDMRQIFFLREDGFGFYPPFLTKKTNEPQVDKNTLETLENMIEEELETRK